MIITYPKPSFQSSSYLYNSTFLSFYIILIIWYTLLQDLRVLTGFLSLMYTWNFYGKEATGWILNMKWSFQTKTCPVNFSFLKEKSGNYRRANHWHQSVEIFLVLEGELKFYINNQSQPLSAGELIIVNSNEIHSIEAPKPNLTLVLQIPVSYFTPYMGKEDYAIFVSQSQEKNRALAVLIEKMYHVYTKKGKGLSFKNAKPLL